MFTHKALLVGINAYPHAGLRGCVNDVLQIRELLQRYYDFSSDRIRLLLDQDATSAAIKAGLAWLAEDGGESNAVRVFHYSGHGAYTVDQNGDEPDGRDECLVPYDYQSAGLITDDTLKLLYDRFPPTGNLTLIMDCCHSGSIQKAVDTDIIYRFLPVSPEEQECMDAAAAKFAQEQQEFVVNRLLALGGRQLDEEELRKKVRQLMTTFERVRFGDIRVRESNLLLAGCRADQQAADAPLGGQYQGAFTHYLAGTIIQSNGHITYHQLAEQTAKKLQAAGFIQIPQLEYRAHRNEQFVFQPFQ